MNKNVSQVFFSPPPPYIEPIYKSFLFDSNGNVNKIIVFNGVEDSNQFDPEKNKQYFTNSEAEEIENKNIPIIWSSLKIHKDDTIKTIKEKIFYEIEKDTTWQQKVPLSTSHLYLFSHLKETIDLVELYQEVTQNEKKPLKKEVFVQILANLNIDYEQYENLEVTEYYDYEDFIKVFQSDQPDPSKITIPIGFQFSFSPRDYTFVANPYLIINASPDNERYSNTTSNNPLKYDENGVLLNYGNITDHNLYCCLYDEVVDFSFKTNIDKDYITELYFPVLSSTNIAVPPPSIKRKTAKEVPIKWRSVDSFYNLYMKTIAPGGGLVPTPADTPTPASSVLASVAPVPDPSTFKIPYISYGIQKMTFKILSGATLTLPLENIFKNIHASAAIPFISFNPRVKKETILRLYSNKISKNGKKIPILKENEISKITKELKRTKAISFYFAPPLPSSTFLQKSAGVYKEIEMYMELCETGEIRLRCSHSSIPFSLNEWNAILHIVFTPLLTELNRILELFGYPLFKFQQLEENENIVIENIKYVEIVKINKPIHLSNINGLSEIFTIIGNKETAENTGTKTGIIDDIAKGVVMRFKRVNDFKENDEQTILITELFKKTRNTEVIIDVLKETFDMNEVEAKTRLTNFIVEHNYELDDIRDSAGFPTLFQLNKLVSANNILTITVDEINSLSYLNILHVYINCILQANLNPSLNPEELVGKKGWAVQLNKSAKVIVNHEMIEKAVKPADEIVAKKAVAAIEFFEDDWIDDESETDIDLKEKGDMEGDMENGINLKEKGNMEFNGEEKEGVTSLNEEEGFRFKTDNSIMPPFPPTPLLTENRDIKFKDNINTQKISSSEEEGSSPDSNIIMMEEEEEGSQVKSQTNTQSSSNSIIMMENESESKSESKRNNENKSKETSNEADDDLIIMDENSDIESDSDSDDEGKMNENGKMNEKSKPTNIATTTTTTTTTAPPLPPSQKGGLTDPNLDGKPISILNRLQSHDPSLFISKKQGKYESYSRMCPSNIDRQPVSLTKEEKENIDKNHPNSYSKAIEYGTTDEKYWYICPRYWCLKTNTSITEEEVKTGKCGGIIPKNATKIPSGHYVYEFNSKTKQHLNPSGEYVNNNPGFLGTDSHPDGKCIPCCFKGSWDKPQQIKRRQECLQKPTEATTNAVATVATVATPANAQKKGDVFYIISFLTYPIQPHRFGFLPLSVQKLFQMDMTKMVLRSNSANIKPDTPCLLRYGVEYSSKQSFISCFAEIYAYKQELEVCPTVQKMKQIMVDTITIDDFVNYHNGSLISVFKDSAAPLPGTEESTLPPPAPSPTEQGTPAPTPATAAALTPAAFLSLKNTQLWKTTFQETDEPSENKIRNFLTDSMEEVGEENMFKLAFLKNILLSYQNFLSYLKDPDIEIDHTFLWDAVTDNHPQLIKDGINLIIIQIPNDDLTDNVEIICPTVSASNKSYDFTNRETFILLKQDDFYEPVYLYEEKDKMIRLTKAFLEKSPVKPVIDTIQTIKSIAKKYCSSQPSRPKIYHFKKNHEIKQTEKILKNNDYKIHLQLSNYQGKIIGLYVSHRANRKSIMKDTAATATPATLPPEGVYIPIYPSSPLLSIPTKFADADDVYKDVYKNYETTLLRLRNIQRTTNGMIYVEPKIKVVEDGLVVGILTETNQYIQLSSPETLENTVAIDGPTPLVTLSGSSYLVADKTLATFQEGDKERVETIRNVSLESQFYLMFRSITRITLGKYQLTSIYIKKINQITNDPALLFKEKIVSLVTVLKEMLKDKVDFKEMDANTINVLDPLMKKAFTDENTTYLIGSLKETGESQQEPVERELQPPGHSVSKLIVPKFNLVTGYDNEILYYTKLADELIRHTRIKLFMFHPRYFSIIPNQTYNIDTSELLVLQSLLTHDYFKDIRVFNIAPQIHNTDYQFAEPAITELYSNKVTREEWMKLETGEGGLVQNVETNPCISSIRPVAGNWSREFVSSNKTTEIVFKNSVICSYSPILYILQQKIQQGGTVTIDLIRKILWKGYNKYLTSYKSQILHVLKKEGKYDLVDRIKKGAVSFETLVSSEDYYMTNLDYWIISLETNTPIILFNSTALKNITGEIDWLFLGGGKIHEEVNYIRSPALIEKNEPPRYSIIVPSFKYTNMKKMKEHIEGAIQGKPEFAKNTVSLTEYLSKISTKEMSTVVKKKIKIVDKDEAANT